MSLLRCSFYAQNRLRGSGHGIAAARMDAKLNVAGWISEQMGGIRWCNWDFSLTYFHPAVLSSYLDVFLPFY